MPTSRRFYLRILTLLNLFWFNQSVADELVLATSKSIPPYIIEETQSGVQLDRVRLVLEHAGHSIKKIVFTSNKRAELLVKQRKVDAIINAPLTQSGLHYSDPVIHYQNVAISLTSAGITLDELDQLKHYRIMAFQNASKYLGKAFADVIKQSPFYDEAINQMAQLERLYLKQVDVIILEHRIFEYYNRRYDSNGRFPSPVTYHYLFPLAPRVLGFHDPKLRDEFNRSLNQLFYLPPEETISNSPSVLP